MLLLLTSSKALVFLVGILCTAQAPFCQTLSKAANTHILKLDTRVNQDHLHVIRPSRLLKVLQYHTKQDNLTKRTGVLWKPTFCCCQRFHSVTWPATADPRVVDQQCQVHLIIPLSHVVDGFLHFFSSAWICRKTRQALHLFASQPTCASLFPTIQVYQMPPRLVLKLF